jgi:hypothetical protein
MEGQDQPMHNGQTWRAVKKRHHSRVLIQALVVSPPGLKRAAGNLQHFGGLTLREALNLASNILLKQLRAFDPIPALVTITIAPGLDSDYRAPSDLLPKPLPWEHGWRRMAR